MLLRRFLRVKVLQGVYSYAVQLNSCLKPEIDEKLIHRAERELINSMEDTGKLAHHIILLLKEIILVAERFLEEERKKFFPDPAIIGKIQKFNSVLSGLSFKDAVHGDATGLKELAVALLNELVSPSDNVTGVREESSFPHRIPDGKPGKQLSADFAKWVIRHPRVEQYVEEKNIFWVDGLHIISPLIIKFIKNCSERKVPGDFSILKNPVADKQFALSLLGFYIQHDGEFEEIIRKKASNWDINRIVLMDKIIMKLAMCELKYFAGMPGKVVLNEYIELAKYFSTPDSSSFINGMLDKIFAIKY